MTVFDFDSVAPSLRTFGAFSSPETETVASSGQLIVTLACFADFCFGSPERSQAGGLSGCQLVQKSVAEDSNSGVASPPSAPISMRSAPAAVKRTKTIFSPSGEKEGQKSLAPVLVTGVWLAPSASITKIWRGAPVPCAKTIFCPSGENDG